MVFSINVFKAANRFLYPDVLFKFISTRFEVKAFDIGRAVFVYPTLYICGSNGKKTLIFKRGIGIERAFEALSERFAEVGILQWVSDLFCFALDLDIVYTQSDVMVLRKLPVLSESYICLKIEHPVNLDDAHHS